MKPGCDYAACPRVAVEDMDDWSFCRQHVLEHLADMHGAPWPTLRPVNQRELLGLAPCGTVAALRRHSRRKQRCETCLAADFRRRNPRGGVWRGRKSA